MARTRPPSWRLRLRQRAAEIRVRDTATKKFLASQTASAKKIAHGYRRQADKLARQASILGRGKIAATRAVLDAQAEALRKQARELDRVAAEYDRPLQFLRVPAKRRTSYQRRTISQVRQRRSALDFGPQWPPDNWENEPFRDRYTNARWVEYARNEPGKAAKLLSEPLEVQLEELDKNREANADWLERGREKLGLQNDQYRAYHTAR